MVEWMDEIVESLKGFVEDAGERNKEILQSLAKGMLAVAAPVWILPYMVLKGRDKRKGGKEQVDERNRTSNADDQNGKANEDQINWFAAMDRFRTSRETFTPEYYEELIRGERQGRNGYDMLIKKKTLEDPGLVLATIGIYHPAAGIVLKYLADAKYAEYSKVYGKGHFVCSALRSNAHGAFTASESKETVVRAT